VERLRQHREGHYKGSATSKAMDWELLLVMSCADRTHARRLERWIKSQNSRAVIQQLIREEGYRTYQVERFL
jgi:putative endonuclease